MKPRTIHLVSWNVTTLAPRLASAGFGVGSLGEPDVLCLQEIGLRPSDAELIEAMACALPGYACVHALSNDPKNATFRGGRLYGVATYVKHRLPITAQYHPSWDREGRVVVAVVGGVAIFNVYAVNGTGKPYYDHDLGRISGDRHAFKRRFNERVMEEALTFRARGCELVLVGDWNISRTKLDATPRLRMQVPHRKARRALNDVIMPTLDVVDAFRELHPSDRKYSWFNDRAPVLDAARVDYALVSRSMMPRVVSADIDELHRAGTDHAPLSLVWRDRG